MTSKCQLATTDAPPARRPRGWRDVALAFWVGCYLALLQFAYFFLLEAFLSSQFVSYFVAVFFWLCGFLAGLQIRRRQAFTSLLTLSAAAYYLSYAAVNMIPFQLRLTPLFAFCLFTSGMAPGCFFPWAQDRFPRLKHLFFHENNGFLLGIVVSWWAADFCGRIYLAFFPGLGFLVCAALLMLTTREGRGDNDLTGDRNKEDPPLSENEHSTSRKDALKQHG